MEACRYFKGDRPCKYYWIDRSWDCKNCSHHSPYAERILLIKLDALGDVLRASPLAEGIKKRYPNAQLTWLTKKNALPFVKNNPFVDKVRIYNEETVRILLNQKFDIVINLDKDDKATALLNACNAHEKRGYGMHHEGYVVPVNESTKYHYTICLDNWGGKTANQKTYQHMIFEMAELQYQYEVLRLDLDQGRALAFKNKLYREEFINEDDYVVILNTGCGPVYPNKKWTYEGFKELIQKLLEDPKVKIILTGAESEIERNANLKRDSHSPRVIDTTNKYNVEEFCFLINVSDMVVTGDTVGLHMAIALKKKIIAFFGPTPHQEIHLFDQGKKFVREELDCLNCYDQFPCPYNSRCMELTKADEVFAEIQRLRQ